MSRARTIRPAALTTIVTIAILLVGSVAGCGMLRRLHREPEPGQGGQQGAQGAGETAREPAAAAEGAGEPHVRQGEAANAEAETEDAAAASTEKARGLWAEALQAGAEGDRLERRRVLVRLAMDAAVSPEGLAARVDLAEEAGRRGRWREMERWASGFDASDLDPELEYRRRRALAFAYEGQESYREAAKAWLDASDAAPGDGEGAPDEAQEGVARSLMLSGDPEAAVGTLSEGDGTSARERLEKLVADRLDRPTLERLIGTLPPENSWYPWVALRLARARCDDGEPARCREAAELAESDGDEAIRKEATALAERAAAWDTVAPRTLGVLLPLSGDYQRIGQAALEGIQLALEGRSEVRLVVRDTRGDTAVAQQQAEELILHSHVAAIFGPVGLHETRAAAEITARYGVPHIVLSSHEDIGEGATNIFRPRLGRREHAQAIARYAFETLSARRFALLYPDDAAGRVLVSAFWDEVVRLGGEVTAVEAYGAERETEAAAVRRLIAAKKPGEGLVDFDALFIPDEAERVRRIVPLIHYWGIPLRTSPRRHASPDRLAVQLLGSAGWSSPRVVDKGENLTDNAVFVASFFHDPHDPANDAFVQRFMERYRRPPQAFQAEVHDAASLAAMAVASADGHSHELRLRIAAALRTVHHHPGAAGPLSFEPDGSPERPSYVLTVDLDDIRLRLPEDEEEAVRKSRTEDRGGALP